MSRKNDLSVMLHSGLLLSSILVYFWRRADDVHLYSSVSKFSLACYLWQVRLLRPDSDVLVCARVAKDLK
jgi:hypothetical protein